MRAMVKQTHTHIVQHSQETKNIFYFNFTDSLTLLHSRTDKHDVCRAVSRLFFSLRSICVSDVYLRIYLFKKKLIKWLFCVCVCVKREREKKNIYNIKSTCFLFSILLCMNENKKIKN